VLGEYILNISSEPNFVHLTVLVQISDIHIGSLYDALVFDKIVEEVNSMKPDAIIVTGDITDEGILPQFELARTSKNRITTSQL